MADNNSLLNWESFKYYDARMDQVINEINQKLGAGGYVIDTELSNTSENPVQNKAITEALETKANKDEIPTSLPANGGNADTVGNLASTAFMQGLGLVSSGSIKDYALSLSKTGGTALVGSAVTDMPVDGYTWFVYITGCGTSHRSILAIPATVTLGVYYMVYINSSETWSGWYSASDGGSADKVKTVKNDYATTGAMYPTFVDSNNASATAEAAKTDYNVRCNIRQGTTSEVGIAQLCLGSITPKGQADNSRGIVLIYGEDAYYVNLSASTSMTGNVDIRLPNASGTLALNTAASATASGLVNITTQTFAGNKTFNGQVLPNGATAYGTPQARKLASGTAAATTTNCPSGGWYGQHS